jgi:hypothetical protein
MSDLRGPLDNEAGRVHADPRALDEVIHRAERRRRARRIATGAVALAVAGGSLGLAYAAFRPGSDPRPAARPIPGPTITPAVERVPLGVIVANGSDTEAAAEFAAALLVGEAVTPEVVVATPPATPRDVTTIHCHPAREEEALQLRDEFFPGAVLRPRIDPRTLLVTVGDDFVRDNRAMFEHYMTVRGFMHRRTQGSGAEAYLSEAAARDYAERVGGLDLYAYAEGGRFQVTSIFGTQDETSIAAVRIMGPNRNRVESITVGDAEPQDGRLEILSAALAGQVTETGPAPTSDQVTAFVEAFLEARHDRSGAGTYLGEDARAAYAAHERGLDLLGYAAGPGPVEARIVAYDKLSPERHRVAVRFDAAGEDPPVVWETLLIGWKGEDILVVLDAERGRAL